MRKLVFAICVIACGAPAHAEVVSSNPNGFNLRYSGLLKVAPDTAFSSFVKIERWWDPDHSYGGKSSGLSMEVTPGGCFCEMLSDGGVEHMRVAYVDAGKRLVLTGGLGPLLYEATVGTMDVKFEPQPGGSRVTMTYKAAGFADQNGEKLAPLVDNVLAAQWARFIQAANKP